MSEWGCQPCVFQGYGWTGQCNGYSLTCTRPNWQWDCWGCCTCRTMYQSTESWQCIGPCCIIESAKLEAGCEFNKVTLWPLCLYVKAEKEGAANTEHAMCCAGLYNKWWNSKIHCVSTPCCYACEGECIRQTFGCDGCCCLSYACCIAQQGGKRYSFQLIFCCVSTSERLRFCFPGRCTSKDCTPRSLCQCEPAEGDRVRWICGCDYPVQPEPLCRTCRCCGISTQLCCPEKPLPITSYEHPQPWLTQLTYEETLARRCCCVVWKLPQTTRPFLHHPAAYKQWRSILETYYPSDLAWAVEQFVERETPPKQKM